MESSSASQRGLEQLPGDVSDLLVAHLSAEDRHFRVAQLSRFLRAIAYAPEAWRMVELSRRFNLHACADACERLPTGTIKHLRVRTIDALPPTSVLSTPFLGAVAELEVFELYIGQGLHDHQYEKLKQLWERVCSLKELVIRCAHGPLSFYPSSVLDWLPLFSIFASTRAAGSVQSLEIGSDPHAGFPEFAIPERLRAFCGCLERMQSLSSLTLRSLHLSGAAIVGLPLLPRVTSLTITHSRSWPRIASRGFFEGFCSKMPALQELRLAPCDARDASLAAVLRECPSLRRLELSGCSSLADVALRDCPALEEVHLEGGILRCASVENCPRLRSLSVDSGVRSSGVRLTAFLRCEALEALRLLYPFFGIYGDEVYPPRFDVFAPPLRALEVRCRGAVRSELDAAVAASVPLSAGAEVAWDREQHAYAARCSPQPAAGRSGAVSSC